MRRRAGERIDLAIAIKARCRPGPEIDHRRRVAIAFPIDCLAQIPRRAGYRSIREYDRRIERGIARHHQSMRLDAQARNGAQALFRLVQ